MLRLDEAPVDASPTVRADRAVLRSPRVQPDGAVRYDAVLAYADRELVYPWGSEVASDAALSDPVYLSALEGLAVTLRHPRSERVDVREPEEGDGRVVGTVLGARWDAEDRAVVLDLVVQDAQALAAIEARDIRELSEGYDVPVLERRKDGPAIQRQRRPNHVALVERGRMPGAVLRADGGTMDDEMKARFDALDGAIGGYKSRMDKCEARMDELQKRMDAAFPPDKAEAEETDEKESVEGRADAVEAEVEARIAARRRCDAHGFTPGAEVRTARDLTRALAAHLGAPQARLDAADGATYAEAWVEARPVPTALDHLRAGVMPRANTTPDPYDGA